MFIFKILWYGVLAVFCLVVLLVSNAFLLSGRGLCWIGLRFGAVGVFASLLLRDLSRRFPQ